MKGLPLAFAVLTAFLTLHIVAKPALKAGDPRCWVPAISPHPLIFKDCDSVIRRQILNEHAFDPDQPLTFSRDVNLNPDIKLPETWTSPGGDCIVGVDIPSTLGGEEKTSLRDILFAAQAVAVECVIKPPHIGGLMLVGWQKKMNVVIVSIKGPPNVRLPGGNGTLMIDEA
ncbi:MAG: hypothetical protein LQ350_007658 [Teloschistes chrysophthalmus]|nr:MAG: hypothetical protein LQ350_007658 [Niorma chrysophthalma]